jgi:hypothetical protein
MQNEALSQPNEDEIALNDLIAMGLIEVVDDAQAGQIYRLSEEIYTDDFTPNASLLERLE